MDTNELVATAWRAVLVYVAILAVVRLSGKRAVGNFSAFDLLVALMLGEVVDEIIYGDVTLAQGGVVILGIAALHYGNSWLSYWDHGFAKVLEGKPAVLVRSGEFQRKAMRRERVSESDVMHELRLQGVTDLVEVKLATLEDDGQVSVLREEWAEPLQKGDVQKKEKSAREEAAARSRPTDSAEALGEA